MLMIFSVGLTEGLGGIIHIFFYNIHLNFYKFYNFFFVCIFVYSPYLRKEVKWKIFGQHHLNKVCGYSWKNLAPLSTENKQTELKQRVEKEAQNDNVDHDNDNDVIRWQQLSQNR